MRSGLENNFVERRDRIKDSLIFFRQQDASHNRTGQEKYIILSVQDSSGSSSTKIFAINFNSQRGLEIYEYFPQRRKFKLEYDDDYPITQDLISFFSQIIRSLDSYLAINQDIHQPQSYSSGFAELFLCDLESMTGLLLFRNGQLQISNIDRSRGRLLEHSHLSRDERFSNSYNSLVQVTQAAQPEELPSRRREVRRSIFSTTRQAISGAIRRVRTAFSRRSRRLGIMTTEDVHRVINSTPNPTHNLANSDIAPQDALRSVMENPLLRNNISTPQEAWPPTYQESLNSPNNNGDQDLSQDLPPQYQEQGNQETQQDDNPPTEEINQPPERFDPPPPYPVLERPPSPPRYSYSNSPSTNQINPEEARQVDGQRNGQERS